MKLVKPIITSVAVIGLVLAVTPALNAHAEESTAQTEQQKADRTQQKRARTQELLEKAKAAREEAKTNYDATASKVRTKLSDRRKSLCDYHESRVKSIVRKSAEQSAKHLGIFQSYEERVKAFYVNKKLSASNYDTLLAVVEQKEVAAVEAVEAVRATVFECDHEGENKEIASFVLSTIKAQHTALKEYRTALKDWMVAVKNVASDAEGEEDKE